MKVKNLNKSSVKTKNLIRKTFAEMLSEKRAIGKISVSELVARADINRGTFYAHYDDIYAVAEDYENELIDRFFDNATLLETQDFEAFLDVFFEYIRQNDETYKMLCKSNDVLFSANKLTTLAENKFLEICHNSKRLVNKDLLQTEIGVFVEGVICSYVKSCRGYTAVTPDELFAFAKKWYKMFEQEHFAP